ncbi:hypothetical protein BJY01DRAFT_259125 [Aspergillus pseudoustus]|uniref:Calcium-activated chloride channel-domain-containing protein n=1 Tax=Aspergillus pseudoustus TaxID=1810923 RepID=A0ABR4J6K3_9EURO
MEPTAPAIEPTTLTSRDTPTLVGWVSEPDGRGTVSLLTTSLTTIFLCTWVVIHPRVYASESFATAHKLALLLKTLLAPEFIAVEGLQEWAQCRRMVEDCAPFSNGEFKLVHAYYVSMLALRYRFPTGEADRGEGEGNNNNKVIWPNQYTWLLRQGLISWTDHPAWGMTIAQIRDKNKTDSITKLITLFQVLWFVATCIMRAANSLPLSQLESMTLSYIPLFAITYFFWWEKPKDILAPTVIDLPDMTLEQRQCFEDMALSDKFDERNAQSSYWGIWALTPRVFEKEARNKALQEARVRAAERAAQVQRGLKSAVSNASEVLGPEQVEFEREKEIVVAHWDPGLYHSKTIRSLCSLFGASFGALHLACWNTTFPTLIEKWLWRGSAFVSIVSLLAFMHYEKVILRWEGFRSIVCIGSPGLYFLSRIVMMVEVFVTIRATEPAIYSTYEIANYGIQL